MDYVMQFMFYVIIGISITVPIAGVIAYNMDGRKIRFKDWIKTF